MVSCPDHTKQVLTDAAGDLLNALLQDALLLLGGLAAKDEGNVFSPKSSRRSVLQEVNAMSDDQKFTQLEQDLQKLTERQFLTSYAYVYNGDRTVPHNLTPNGFLTSSEDFVCVPAGDTVTMTQYVDNTILGQGSGLPDWFTRRFTNDLISTMTVLVEKGNMNWQYEKYTQQYKDPNNQMNPISVAAIMYYATASITEGGQTADYSIMYYAGVYYNSYGFSLSDQRTTMIESALQGSVGLPPISIYQVTTYSIFGGTDIVAASLGYYLLSLAPPNVKAVLNLKGPNVDVSLNFRDDKALLTATNAGSGNPTQWIETALKNIGFFRWKRTEQQADAATSAKIALLWIYTEKNSYA